MSEYKRSKYKVGDKVIYSRYSCAPARTVSHILYGDDGKTYYKLLELGEYIISEKELVKISRPDQCNNSFDGLIEKVIYSHYRYPSLKETLEDNRNASAKITENKYIYLLIDNEFYFIDSMYIYSRNRQNKFKPSANGGETRCVIVLKNGIESVGTSECSVKDNFCYKTGREIAYQRALAKLEEIANENSN